MVKPEKAGRRKSIRLDRKSCWLSTSMLKAAPNFLSTGAGIKLEICLNKNYSHVYVTSTKNLNNTKKD